MALRRLDAELVHHAGADAPGLPLHGLLAVASVAVAIGAQGAFYPPGQRLVALVLVLTLAATGLRARPAAEPRWVPVLRAGAALGLWSVVCAAVAGDASRATSTVAVLVGMAIVAGAVRRCTAGERDAVEAAVLAVGVGAALVGWAGVALHRAPWAMVDQHLWRASGTVTYPNATAAILAPLALLAIGRLTRRPSAGMRACAVVLVTGLGATLSRGGAVAFAVGLAALVVLVGWRRVVAVGGPALLGAAVGLGALAVSMPASAAANPAVGGLGLVAGVAFAGWAAGGVRRAAAGAVVVVVLGTAALAASGSFGTLGEIGERRLTVASSDRRGEAEAALRLVADHPVFGTGPSWHRFAWTAADGERRVARYVHNEYLQTVAELGLMGGALLVWLLVALARAVVGAWPRPPSWAGAAAGLAALAVHAAFDFGWHVPAVALTGALLVGMSLPPNNEETR